MIRRLLLLLFIIIGGASPIFAQDTDLPEPLGCQVPPDNYEQVSINGSVLNRRTLAMLEHAQTLYGGSIDLANLAITQGSYNEGVIALSFGTHDGGGAVDISVRNFPVDWSILWDDIPLVIKALRTAGFAAWYRDEDDGMEPHIHAIAIGDAELSRAASLQLDGHYGYFQGYNGLPQANGVPQLDEFGEPILCDWMHDLGYADLREDTPAPIPPYQLLIGEQVTVNTLWGEELNLREEPSTRTAIIIRLPTETRVTILDGPQFGEAYRWWQVETESGEIGWVVDAIEDNLTLVP